ncbi:ApeP family dehydratase [Phytohalomonas tamaricis]|uniref:ApeP family dehydratase n=1 Tax=Phytohalomonas tamaricis TaxID=2081032 RepID=UPI000D0BBC4C|nr:hypothetical protein [Phytohalomonas tamaricis]
MSYPPIASLVPHQGPMCLLDDVIACDARSLTARVIPRRDSLLVDLARPEAGIPVWAGLEWMAQAVAAWAGLNSPADIPPRIGLLLGTKHYSATCEHLPFDVPVDVVITLDFQADNGLGTFQGQLTCRGERLAEATLNVFQPSDSDELFTS